MSSGRRVSRVVAVLSLALCVLWLSACEGAGGGAAGPGADAAGPGADAAGPGADAAADALAGLDVDRGDLPAPADVGDVSTASPDVPGGPDDAEAPPPDVPEPPGPSVRFDLSGSDFYDSPFPSVLRTAANGALAWDAMPNPGNVPLITNYVASVMALSPGAGCNGAVWFGLDEPLDATTLPTPMGSLAPGAAVQLVDIDPQSPEYGSRHAVHARVVTDASSGFFTPPVLAIQPVFGLPLRSDTLYAAVLTRDLRGVGGGPLRTAAPVARALAGEGPADLQAAFAPLAAALADLHLAPADIAAATVFRTFDPTVELKALRDWIRTAAPLPEVLSLAEIAVESGYRVYEGRFSSLNFQQGTPPYDREGGFAWDGATPRTRREELAFTLVVPDTPVETAPGRTPFVISSHGTGGDHRSCVDDGSAGHVAAVGLPSICISQPLHGDRWSGSGDPALLELYSFNFANPPAGVSVLRQGALDNVLLLRLLVDGPGFELPGAAARTLRPDPDEIYFFGHSQGGIVGTLFFGVEPDVRGGVISGAGGVLMQTILHRADPPDLRQLLSAAARISDPTTLTTDHPLLVLVQNGSDLTDPINYARLINRPGNRKHIMMTEGTKDAQTPAEAAEPLATALRLPLLAPIAHLPEGHQMLGLTEPISLPFSGTVDVGDGTRATAFLVQFANANHFPIFYDSRARMLYKKLYTALTMQDVPVME
jgi:hypothetical protein